MELVVDFGYKEDKDVTRFCAVVVREGEVIEEETVERDGKFTQYENGMNAFSLAAKLVKDVQEDYGYNVSSVTYRSVQQFLDKWVEKGNKKYSKRINYITSVHRQVGLQFFDYQQQNGGREGKKVNRALAILNNKKSKGSFDKWFNNSGSDNVVEDDGDPYKDDPFVVGDVEEYSNVKPFLFIVEDKDEEEV